MRPTKPITPLTATATEVVTETTISKQSLKPSHVDAQVDCGALSDEGHVHRRRQCHQRDQCGRGDRRDQQHVAPAPATARP